jgi:hypothetical protein
MSLPFHVKSTNDDSDKSDKDKKKVSGVVLLFLLIWVALGITAYVKAYRCTASGLDANHSRNIVMFLLAVMLGPFWWILYPIATKNGYCKPL